MPDEAPVAVERQHIIIGADGVLIYFNEVADRQHVVGGLYFNEET